MALQDRLRSARGEGSAPMAWAAARPWRSDLALAWLVILLPAMAIATILGTRQRVDDLEERLVRDVNALFSRSHPRPVHVDAPSPGATGDLASPHLQAIANIEKRLESDIETLREVVAGATPVGSLRPPVSAALADAAPDLDALLAATRAERADFPDSLGFAGEGGWFKTWQFAALLSGVRMRTELVRGEPRRAVRDGLDALALGRDVAIARGLMGRMVDVAIVRRLAPVVSTALCALPGRADRLDALRRIRMIRDALPPFSRTLGDELTYTQLLLGDVISARARSALDARARAVLREGFRDTAWWTRLAVRDGWRDLRRAQDEIIAAADLPEAERTARWNGTNARLMRLPNPIAAIGLPSYRRYAVRAEASIRRLDALVLAAAAGAFRDSRGRWPRSVDEIASDGEIDAGEAARLRDAVFEIDPRARTLSLILPLPRLDEDEPGEMRLALSGPSGRSN